MDFLGGLGLVLLTMVAYSIGRVLPDIKHLIGAELYDGVIIITLWVLALTISGIKEPLAYLLWIGTGVVTGALITLAVRASLPAAETNITPESKNCRFFSKLWARWKAFAFRMGSFQGRLILLLFYFTILAPFGIVNSLFRNPLMLRNPAVSSFWFPMEASDEEIDEARRQF
jgi:hypothetical protein